MHRSFLLSVGLLTLVLGCDEDSGHPTLDTGLPADQPIGDLSAEESAQVCEGTEVLLNELGGPERQAQIQCAIVGIVTEATHQGECAPAVDNCLQNGDHLGVPIDLPCDYAIGTSFPGCEATIGQLEACVNDFSAGVDTVLDAVGCGLVDDPDALTDLSNQLAVALDPATHEACAGLADACLAFLDLPSVSIDVNVTVTP